jgi:hypothetical protein
MNRLWQLLALVAWSSAIALADSPNEALGQAAVRIERVLPAGWSIVENKSGEIPWGHHWCDEYSGPKGLKIVVVGPSQVSVEMQVSGEWRSFSAAREALDIWVMPSQYSDSWKSSFCFHRPIQPAAIDANGSFRMYARPAHRLNSEVEFRELLSKAGASAWPASPLNDPSRLSWKTWPNDLKSVVTGGK